ncbi:MAG: CotH kinase family protein, partial [Spirochaetales bacterium]|nr:CotH kinase family protein [Spirochaetales bacterium]
MKVPIRMSFLLLFPLTLFSCDLIVSETPEVEGVTNIYLSMSDDEVQFLKESNGYDGDYTHCYYEEEGEVIHAWIKARGFSSRQSYKRSFTIKTEEDDESEPKYAFNACYTDPSCIRNRLAFSAYQEMDVPAPDVEATALFLNDEYLGYYDKVTIYDGESLMDYYDADSLELYKAHFYEDYGTNTFGEEHPLQSLTEKKYPDDDDYETLNSMIIKFLELDDDEWNLWVEDNFDVESTARYCAVHKLLNVGDTDVFNFYIVVVDDKFSLLPWDNEQCLYSSDIELSRLHSRLLIDGSPVKTRYEELMADFVADDNDVIDNLLTHVEEYMAEIDRAVYYD